MTQRKLAIPGVMVVVVCLMPRPALAQSAPAWVIGKAVVVTLTDASVQPGKLVSLSQSEVVILHDSKSVRFPLGRVRKITATTRPLRKMVLGGLLAGAVAGPFVLACRDGGGECPASYIQLPFSVGIGAGVGATAGAILGRLQRPTQRVVYAASPVPVQLTLAPWIAPGARGFALTVRW